MFEFDWFFFGILAAVANGLQGFLYKSAVQKKDNPYVVTFSSATVSYFIAGIFFLIQKSSIGDIKLLILFGIIGGIGFISVMLIRFKALQSLPTGVFFTGFRSSVIFILVIFFILPEPFHEEISLAELIGIFLITITLFILGPKRQRGAKIKLHKSFFLIFAAAFISALLYTTQKIAVDNYKIDIHSFIFVINLVIAFITLLFMIAKRRYITSLKSSLKSGAFIGIYGFLSFMFFLQALKNGLLPLVVSVNSASFIIPIILSTYYFKEKLNIKTFVTMILVCAGLIIIRIFGN